MEEWYNEEMEADNEEAERKKKELIDKENENKLGTKREEDEDNIKNEENNINGMIDDIEEKEKDGLIDENNE